MGTVTSRRGIRSWREEELKIKQIRSRAVSRETREDRTPNSGGRSPERETRRRDNSQGGRGTRDNQARAGPATRTNRTKGPDRDSSSQGGRGVCRGKLRRNRGTDPFKKQAC